METMTKTPDTLFLIAKPYKNPDAKVWEKTIYDSARNDENRTIRLGNVKAYTLRLESIGSTKRNAGKVTTDIDNWHPGDVCDPGIRSEGYGFSIRLIPIREEWQP